MPADPSRYPPNWRAFSERVRVFRAGERCECRGECGLHRTTPGPRRCTERQGEPARWMKAGTRVVLTVAHLNATGGPCDCDPLCADEAHVLAMCQRCHLRYDAPRHAANAKATARRKRQVEDEAAGVQVLFP